MVALERFAGRTIPSVGPAEVATPPTWSRPKPETELGGLNGHPMLYAGEGHNVLYLVNGGAVVWTYRFGQGGEIDDVWLLSNSHILCARQHWLDELTPAKEVSWEWHAPPGTEVHTVQPIGTERVAFVLNGLPPKLMVINQRTGAIELEFSLPAESATDPKSVHPQTRRMRVTPAGTFLISLLRLGKVCEYNRGGTEIWSYAIATPWSAIRLKNGNTLIVSEREGLIREVTPAKATAWEWRKTELPAGISIRNIQTAERLANGNTVVLCNTSGATREQRSGYAQAVEVTPGKKVVWVLQDWEHLGPATTAQFLDQPGVPEQPGDLQR